MNLNTLRSMSMLFPRGSRSIHPLACSLALLTLPTFIQAQDAKVRVKVNADLNARPDEGVAVGRMVKGDQGSIVTVKTKGGTTVFGGLTSSELDWSLVSYDKDKMTVIKSEKPKIVWGEGPVALETITHFGGQFRMIASKPDPEKAKLLVLQQVLSPRGLTGKAAQLLVELPYDRLGKGADYFRSDMSVGFTTTTSIDSTRLLLGLSPSSTTRSAGAPVWAMVFDRQMRPLWNNTLTTDPAAKEVHVISTQVDRAGSVWYLVKNVSDPAPKTREVLGYEYVLYRLDSAGQESVPLKLAGKNFIQDARVELLPNGGIRCGGIYSDPEANRNESKGLFRMELGQGEQKWQGINLFPFDLQTVKKVERLQNDMRIMDMVLRSDGGIYLLAEKAGMETTMVSDLSGKKVAKTQWVNGPIHIMHLGRSGETPVWYKQIDRQLAYDNASPGRSIAAVRSDVLFLFYNDNVKNIENRKNKAPVEAVTNGKDLVMLEFKSDGNDKGKVMLQEGMKQGYLRADTVWPIAPGLIGTLGAPNFGKDKTYPVLVELLQETKK